MDRFFRKVSQDDVAIGLTYQKAMFRLSGIFLWRQPPLFGRLLYPILPFFINQAAVILTFVQVFRSDIRTLDDFMEMIFSLVIGLIFGSAWLKFILLHWSKKNVKELVNFLESLPRLEGFKRVETMQRVCLWYIYLLIMTGVIKYSDSLLKGELPFKCAWPFDTNNTIGWWTAYITDIILVAFCLLQCGLDTLLVMAVTLMSGHLARLRQLLSNIGRNPAADESIIKSAISLHLVLLHGAKLINRTYKVLIMYQSLYAILHAVVIIFYLVKVSEVMTALAAFFLLLGAYSQLLVYCTSGQQLTSEFENVHVALFQNQWYRSRPIIRKAMVMMAMVSKKPVIVHNYGIFTALHTTFLKSCQESLSYYIILKTVALQKFN